MNDKPIPENLKAAMKKYAELVNERENDPKILSMANSRKEIQRSLNDLDADIATERSKYKGPIIETELWIASHVKELGYSVEHQGVEVLHRSGYTHTTWDTKIMKVICEKDPHVASKVELARKTKKIDPTIKFTYNPPSEG